MPRKIKQYTNPFLKAKELLLAPGSSALPNIQSAIALHQQGQLGQAEAVYQQLLEIDPRNADALHLLCPRFQGQGQSKSVIALGSHFKLLEKTAVVSKP